MADVPDARAAARNNAEWCHAFCRSRGIAGRFDAGLWSSAARTPPFYPDAVTLRPGVPAEAVLSAIDSGPGASVKDSFADLELGAFGFDVLFRAEWICRTDAERDAHGWSKVTDPAGLERWERAWGEVDGSFFLPVLLDEPAVAVLERDDGEAGAVANRSPGVIGLTNVFGADLAEAAAAAQAVFGRLPVVCYEQGDVLRSARRSGFVSHGGLTVWIKP